jgi:hypothetical protein
MPGSSKWSLSLGFLHQNPLNAFEAAQCITYLLKSDLRLRSV